ncbi:hypothetical protein PRECH8_00800 [Insulibacter thermoxylanivorax]|uniref:Small integral membrane protein n=1 Tax=Insulibacter thermoxylanivorax TaxID=2749268 RepID=A0A916VEM8_9BACL|nr:DUF2273 domain-containing protein [Insulibacter thermoxylanivorax]GFR36784.1 hypothetical protein PRECH8_00800 [Insulibacter thermoxylanivorax]
MWNELWEKHRATCLGVLCGLFLGVIYLFFGFWDMLVFGFLILVGYYIGRKIDAGEEIVNLEELYKWMTDRWRMFK